MMAVDLKTGRGIYHLDSAAAPKTVNNDLILTLALTRADGIERVVFRCRIGKASGDSAQPPETDRLIERIAPSIEREFEIIREAALKSIRSERKLLEIALSPT
jgi:hypothetical protein